MRTSILINFLDEWRIPIPLSSSDFTLKLLIDDLEAFMNIYLFREWYIVLTTIIQLVNYSHIDLCQT